MNASSTQQDQAIGDIARQAGEINEISQRLFREINVFKLADTGTVEAMQGTEVKAEVKTEMTVQEKLEEKKQTKLEEKTQAKIDAKTPGKNENKSEAGNHRPLPEVVAGQGKPAASQGTQAITQEISKELEEELLVLAK